MSDTRDSLALCGTVLADKYSIEKVVGAGGFAVVYRGTHLLWKRPVAIKVFRAFEHVSTERRQALLDDFIREGALLADLSARCLAICQARDVGLATAPAGNPFAYLVLEWLEGATLHAILRQDAAIGSRPRGLNAAISLMTPIAQALALAHDRGIAHRDVKPANIFVMGDPSSADAGVKLLDFGIAKVVERAQEGGFHQTTGEFAAFTPSYGAPEQFSRTCGATGPWTDVFALALIMVELVSGKRALTGGDVGAYGFAATDATRRSRGRLRRGSGGPPRRPILHGRRLLVRAGEGCGRSPGGFHGSRPARRQHGAGPSELGGRRRHGTRRTGNPPARRRGARRRVLIERRAFARRESRTNPGERRPSSSG